MSNHEVGKARESAALGAHLPVKEVSKISKKWTITKYKNPEDRANGVVDDVLVIERNLLLNEGINEALELICGLTATAFSNANAYIGVGDSATAAAATDTGLIATTNEEYQAMEATYPQVSGQTATWRAEFGATEGNFAWNEITVANGNSDASVNLNRLVTSMGTKANPAVWTVDLDITLS